MDDFAWSSTAVFYGDDPGQRSRQFALERRVKIPLFDQTRAFWLETLE